ncbi:MAG: nitroreductase family protein [Caulobacteraceae bacterium]
MDVSEAVRRRMSVRAFRPEAPPPALVREILELAHGAPSGGNLQPWRVYALAGEPLAQLKAEAAANGPEASEYDVYPPDLWEPFRTRRYQCGEDLYASIGIPREDRPGRLRQLARNLDFFGAPVGLFFCLDRKLGPPQWADVGMFMQNLIAPGDPTAVGSQGRDRGALLRLERMERLSLQVADPDAAIVEPGREHGSLARHANDESRIVEADLRGLLAHRPVAA